MCLSSVLLSKPPKLKNYLVNLEQITENIFPSGSSGNQNTAKRKVKIGLKILRWLETIFQMNADASPMLLDVG